MYHIFIPYLAEGAQGNELGYAVAGWRRHFKEEYHITVIGDWHPVVDTGDDISFIQCERVPDPGPGNYRPHIDHVHKFRTALQAYPGIEGFIYACDHNSYIVEDIYFNMYFRRRKPYRLDAERDNLKLGLYGDVPAETIREAFSRKIWITNSPLGWRRDLGKLLMEHYDL